MVDYYCHTCNDGEDIEALRFAVAAAIRGRDAAIKRFETQAKNNSNWGVENSIMRDALEKIKPIARSAIKDTPGHPNWADAIDAIVCEAIAEIGGEQL